MIIFFMALRSSRYGVGWIYHGNGAIGESGFSSIALPII